MTLSNKKEELLEKLLKDIKPLEDKIEDHINMLLSQINAVKDATDAKHDKLLEHNIQAKEDIIAQVSANTDKIIARVSDFESKLNLTTRKCISLIEGSLNSIKFWL